MFCRSLDLPRLRLRDVVELPDMSAEEITVDAARALPKNHRRMATITKKRFETRQLLSALQLSLGYQESGQGRGKK